MGIYGFQDKPIVCGGYNGSTMFGDCFLLENGAWTISYPMVYPKVSAALTLSPFSNSSQILFMTGGQKIFNVGTNDCEILTTTGWELFTPSLPMAISLHSMLLWNSSTVIIVGGIQGGAIGNKTYLISDKNRVWVEGPSITFATYGHGCARINQLLELL